MTPPPNPRPLPVPTPPPGGRVVHDRRPPRGPTPARADPGARGVVGPALGAREDTATFDRVAPVLPPLRAGLHREDVTAVARLLAANSELLLLATRALDHATDPRLEMRGPALLTLRRAIARVQLGLADLPDPGIAPRGVVRQDPRRPSL